MQRAHSLGKYIILGKVEEKMMTGRMDYVSLMMGAPLEMLKDQVKGTQHGENLSM